MLKVTNGNEFDFIGKHNGVEYAFPCGSPVYVPDDAATHIFGLGASDKSSVLARHGWAGPTKTYKDGMSVLNKFVFDHQEPVYDAPLARELMEAATELAAQDHGLPPVIQNAPAGGAGTDGSASSAGAVAEQHKQGKKRAPGAAATDSAG